MAPLVGVIMGSDSDLPVMKAACEMLEKFKIEYECTIVSAHRTPDRLVEYARSARRRGLKVIVAGAGGAAHLPGMVAAMTPLPVVGVPVKTSALSGVDSLHSIVQMPRGVPVATVAIGNATNAGLLAARILSTSNDALADALEAYAASQRDEVLGKAEVLEGSGWKAYLERKEAPKSTTVMCNTLFLVDLVTSRGPEVPPTSRCRRARVEAALLPIAHATSARLRRHAPPNLPIFLETGVSGSCMYCIIFAGFGAPPAIGLEGGHDRVRHGRHDVGVVHHALRHAGHARRHARRHSTSHPWHPATRRRRRAPRLRLLRAAVALGRGLLLGREVRRALLLALLGARLRRLGLDLGT